MSAVKACKVYKFARAFYMLVEQSETRWLYI